MSLCYGKPTNVTFNIQKHIMETGKKEMDNNVKIEKDQLPYITTTNSIKL